MGKFSSSDSERESRRRRHSRSRSVSSNSNSYTYSKKKHKKSSRRRRTSSSRSRSPSRNRSYSDSRRKKRHSSSSSRNRSRSRSRERSSRRKAKHKRHRRRRSRSSSESSGKYSKSRSKDKAKDASKRDKSTPGVDKYPEKRLDSSKVINVDDSDNVVVVDLTEAEALNRNREIDAIESSSFVQKTFVSSKTSKNSGVKTENGNSDFDFGTQAELKSKKLIELEQDSLFSPHFFGDPSEREEKYLRKLLQWRMKLTI